MQEVFNILRVIAGSAKGHRLKTLKGFDTRPTTDRIKESLFNIIREYVVNADILDLFAGTGSLGIEALSRGARSAVFIDSCGKCTGIIKENLKHTNLLDKSRIYRNTFDSGVKILGKTVKFNIIFMDPPYDRNFVENSLISISNNDIIKDTGIIAVEKSQKEKVPKTVQNLYKIEERIYGKSILSFFSKLK